MSQTPQRVGPSSSGPSTGMEAGGRGGSSAATSLLVASAPASGADHLQQLQQQQQQQQQLGDADGARRAAAPRQVLVRPSKQQLEQQPHAQQGAAVQHQAASPSSFPGCSNSNALSPALQRVLASVIKRYVAASEKDRGLGAASAAAGTATSGMVVAKPPGEGGAYGAAPTRSPRRQHTPPSRSPLLLPRRLHGSPPASPLPRDAVYSPERSLLLLPQTPPPAPQHQDPGAGVGSRAGGSGSPSLWRMLHTGDEDFAAFMQMASEVFRPGSGPASGEQRISGSAGSTGGAKPVGGSKDGQGERDGGGNEEGRLEQWGDTPTRQLRGAAEGSPGGSISSLGVQLMLLSSPDLNADFDLGLLDLLSPTPGSCQQWPAMAAASSGGEGGQGTQGGAGGSGAAGSGPWVTGDGADGGAYGCGGVDLPGLDGSVSTGSVADTELLWEFEGAYYSSAGADPLVAQAAVYFAQLVFFFEMRLPDLEGPADVAPLPPRLVQQEVQAAFPATVASLRADLTKSGVDIADFSLPGSASAVHLHLPRQHPQQQHIPSPLSLPPVATLWALAMAAAKAKADAAGPGGSAAPGGSGSAAAPDSSGSAAAHGSPSSMAPPDSSGSAAAPDSSGLVAAPDSSGSAASPDSSASVAALDSYGSAAAPDSSCPVAAPDSAGSVAAPSSSVSVAAQIDVLGSGGGVANWPQRGRQVEPGGSGVTGSTSPAAAQATSTIAASDSAPGGVYTALPGNFNAPFITQHLLAPGICGQSVLEPSRAAAAAGPPHGSRQALATSSAHGNASASVGVGHQQAAQHDRRGRVGPAAVSGVGVALDDSSMSGGSAGKGGHPLATPQYTPPPPIPPIPPHVFPFGVGSSGPFEVSPPGVNSVKAAASAGGALQGGAAGRCSAAAAPGSGAGGWAGSGEEGGRPGSSPGAAHLRPPHLQLQQQQQQHGNDLSYSVTASAAGGGPLVGAAGDGGGGGAPAVPPRLLGIIGTSAAAADGSTVLAGTGGGGSSGGPNLTHPSSSAAGFGGNSRPAQGVSVATPQPELQLYLLRQRLQQLQQAQRHKKAEELARLLQESPERVEVEFVASNYGGLLLKKDSLISAFGAELVSGLQELCKARRASKAASSSQSAACSSAAAASAGDSRSGAGAASSKDRDGPPTLPVGCWVFLDSRVGLDGGALPRGKPQLLSNVQISLCSSHYRLMISQCKLPDGKAVRLPRGCRAWLEHKPHPGAGEERVVLLMLERAGG